MRSVSSAITLPNRIFDHIGSVRLRLRNDGNANAGCWWWKWWWDAEYCVDNRLKRTRWPEHMHSTLCIICRAFRSRFSGMCTYWTRILTAAVTATMVLLLLLVIWAHSLCCLSSCGSLCGRAQTSPTCPLAPREAGEVPEWIRIDGGRLNAANMSKDLFWLCLEYFIIFADSFIIF